MAVKTTKPNYRELNVKLDELLLRLQDPNVDVDEATKLYEDGLKLITEIEKHLHEAETTITKINTALQAENDT